MKDEKVMDSIIDLANKIGFEVIDQEVEAWVEAGIYDETVKKRARQLGWLGPKDHYSDADPKLF